MTRSGRRVEGDYLDGKRQATPPAPPKRNRVPYSEKRPAHSKVVTPRPRPGSAPLQQTGGSRTAGPGLQRPSAAWTIGRAENEPAGAVSNPAASNNSHSRTFGGRH